MMINVLDEKLINKIAAGEVIERPVNVVKELVENSFDAGAKKILVEIKDAFILVEDDGRGMFKGDLEKCTLRHATSKIKEFEDLINVGSFGFRGEALSSIAAVSDLTISSKPGEFISGGVPEELIEGNEIRVEGGVLRHLKSKGMSRGTTIEVRDLFFNTPVRKKFLDSRENERIVKFLEKFVLGNKVRFKLVMNGKVVLEVNSEDLLDRMAEVYGVDVVKHMREVNHEELGLKMKGFVSEPSLLRSDRGRQAIFVNGRLVESEEINKGLYDAYKSILFVNKHPIVVLNLEMKGVDVNVHPAKKIVKFSLPDLVYTVVSNGVRNVFKDRSVVFEAEPSIVNPQKETEQKLEVFNVHNRDRGYFKEDSLRFQRETQVEFFDRDKKEASSKLKKLPEMRLLGVINKTYFLAEVQEGLMLIDQHVVEERINFEKFMKQYMDQKIEIQELLSPEMLEFSSSEAMGVRSNLDRLKKFGFGLEEFGGNNFRLRSVPLMFNKVKGKELLKEVLSSNFKNEEKEDIITRMSCRLSVKAGDTVSIAQMYNLLSDLDACELPFTCPHGRPIMVKLSISDLEKMFRRKGF